MTTTTHTPTVEHRPSTRYPYVAVCDCRGDLANRLTAEAAQMVADTHLAELAACGDQGPQSFLCREVCYLPAGHAGSHDSGSTTWER